MMSPGIKLRTLRERRGLSQREVAEITGVSCATYSAYERDCRLPSQLVKERLSQLFGVSVEELFGDKRKNRSNEEYDFKSGETYKEYKMRVFPRYQGIYIRPGGKR